MISAVGVDLGLAKTLHVHIEGLPDPCTHTIFKHICKYVTTFLL